LKKFIIVTVLVFFATSIVGSVFSMTIESRDVLKLEQPNFEEIEFSPAKNIVITPILSPAGSFINPEEWVKGIHYYSTVRLGYPDVPFHYVVFDDGRVIKTSSSGDEMKVDIENLGDDYIIVGYLAETGSTNFSNRGVKSLQELTSQLANLHGIKSNNIISKSLRYKLNQDTKIVQIEARDIVSGWTQSMKDITAYVDANYNPSQKKYNVEILAVKLPQAQVTPGETVIVEISLKNNSDFSIYADDESALILSKEDRSLSKFYLNGSWASQSQVYIMQEGEILKPRQEMTYQVKFNVPLYFGKQSESFVLQNAYGSRLSDVDVKVELDVASIDKTVVEILETGTGFLNVRDRDSGNASVITKVSPGERYILKTRGQFGYVEILLGDGQSGWVSQNYVRVVR